MHFFAGGGGGEPESEQPSGPPRGSVENGVCGFQQEDGRRSTAAQRAGTQAERLAEAS